MGRTPRAGPPDEKVTVNLGPVDLGKIDLLVEEGFFGSRADFIRSAVRRLADDHRQVLQEAATRREFTLGYVRQSRKSLELARRKKERLDIRVVGVFEIAEDVTPELAKDTLERVWVLGALRAPAQVVSALGPRIARNKGAGT
ncbi:MAG TPA: hypothetical protein VE990_05520 [Acidimicrobiales bacterium]|nr:hypothetical protein [Acidimicrobiales bacterium]